MEGDLFFCGIVGYLVCGDLLGGIFGIVFGIDGGVVGIGCFGKDDVVCLVVGF